MRLALVRAQGDDEASAGTGASPCSARMGDCRCGGASEHHTAGAGLHYCSTPGCAAMWANSGMYAGEVQRPYVVRLPTSTDVLRLADY